jgi:hypothetical protein
MESLLPIYLQNCRHVSPGICASSIYSLSTSVYNPISISLLIVSTSCLLLSFDRLLIFSGVNLKVQVS